MIQIPLTQGLYALIDDEDYDLVMSISHKWFAHKSRNMYYADVYFFRGYWIAQITKFGEQRFLGRFTDKDAAIAARLKAEHDYANPN